MQHLHVLSRLSYNRVVVIACVFVFFLSFLFAALVANKVIIISVEM